MELQYICLDGKKKNGIFKVLIFAAICKYENSFLSKHFSGVFYAIINQKVSYH